MANDNLQVRVRRRPVFSSPWKSQDMITKIAVINSHPIQYFAPLYAFLNQDPTLEVTALYLSDFSLRGGHDKGFGQKVSWDLDLLAGYPHRFLGNSASRRPSQSFFSLIAPEVWNVIRAGNYDALWLHGHGYVANIIAFAAARSIGLPVLMRAETHLKLHRGVLKKMGRRLFLGGLYGHCARLLAIGSENHDFYRSFGVPETKIFHVPYAVDNARFIKELTLSTLERAEVRKRLGVLDDHPVVLYASKFQPHKRRHDLVKACAILASENISFHLVMVGSGEMEQELRSLAKANGLASVIFPGFVNQSELPRIYAAADVFVLPSEVEPWGLVVNEAMCAGLPIVTTGVVGCAADLVL